MSKARSFGSCEVVAASCASIAPFFFSKCLAIALKASRSSRNTVMNVLFPIGIKTFITVFLEEREALSAIAKHFEKKNGAMLAQEAATTSQDPKLRAFDINFYDGG